MLVREVVALFVSVFNSLAERHVNVNHLYEEDLPGLYFVSYE